MEQLELICGLPQTADVDSIQAAIAARAERQDMQVVYYFCRSKIEVEHAVACAGSSCHVLLQELFIPFDPYKAWELSAIRDVRNVDITISLSKNHYGSSYLAVLYASGILDAVYEEEATASCIAEHIFSGRGRKACREYYGITIAEAMGTVQIIEQSVVKRYVHHLGAASCQEDMVKRFAEIAELLDPIQKHFLASQLPPEYVQILMDNRCLERYSPNRKKKEKQRNSLRKIFRE